MKCSLCWKESYHWEKILSVDLDSIFWNFEHQKETWWTYRLA